LAQPTFQQVFGTSVSLKEVELERLIAFQRHIDLEYSTELAAAMSTDEATILSQALPLEFKQNVQVTFDQAVPGVTFSSVSPKLQAGGAPKRKRVPPARTVETLRDDRRVAHP